MQRGPTSTCTDRRSLAIQTRKQPPWLNAGTANPRLGSRRWWDEPANESTSGCGESDWQRSRVKLISCTAPVSSPAPTLSNVQILYTCTREFQEELYIGSTFSYMCWEDLKSAAVSAIVICETGRLFLWGTQEDWEGDKEWERKEKNKQDVSSFRFTVVVGEIWLCSYSTLRTEQEEE